MAVFSDTTKSPFKSEKRGCNLNYLMDGLLSNPEKKKKKRNSVGVNSIETNGWKKVPLPC
jgi:hypothetical protein